MAIDTSGTVSVAEAARRLNRSTEQVRRYLREGKLAGHRIGNQWFVEERALERLVSDGKIERLIPEEVMERIARTRQAIYERTGKTFDIVAALREDRESH